MQKLALIAALAGCFAVSSSMFVAPGSYSSYCNVTRNGAYSVLNSIQRQQYTSTIVSDIGVAPVVVDFSWCSPVLSSAVCGVSNYSMAITGNDAAGNPTCWGAFSAISAPGIPLPTGNGVQFTIWSPMQGATGTVSVYCDPNGNANTATLRSPIVNTPIYQFNFNFTSKAACV